MFNKIKSELLNFGMKFISVDEKLVRLFLETSPSNVGGIVILPATKMVMKKILNKLQEKRVHGRVYNGILNGVRVSVVRSLVGCPNCAVAIEALKRCNTKIVLRVDFCGGIISQTNSVSIGDIIIPKIAYCGDGTSPSYFLKYPAIVNQLNKISNPIMAYQNVITGNQVIFSVLPNEELKACYLEGNQNEIETNINEGDLWTTDALFCETYEFIKALRSINVNAVDMESSILFLLGKLFNIKTVSILSVSDLPGSDNYDLFKTNQIHPDMENGIDRAIKLLISKLPKIKSMIS